MLPFILNASRSRLVVNGDGPPVASPRTELDRALNQFAADLPVFWGDSRLDAVTIQGALLALHRTRPRVLYVLLGETDEWAHARRYDLYLDAAHRADRFLQRLWEWIQATPEYAGRTSLIVSADHGRGSGEKDWTDHGEEVPAADRIWMAVMGPETPALGIRTSLPATQAQFAATLAALVGEDFANGSTGVARPIAGTVRSEK